MVRAGDRFFAAGCRCGELKNNSPAINAAALVDFVEVSTENISHGAAGPGIGTLLGLQNANGNGGGLQTGIKIGGEPLQIRCQLGEFLARHPEPGHQTGERVIAGIDSPRDRQGEGLPGECRMPSSTMRMTVRDAQVLPRDVSWIKSTFRTAFAVTAVAARAALDLGRNLHVAEKRFDLATLAIHALKVDFFATVLLRIQRRIRKDGSQERKWQECGGKPSCRSMARR